MSGNSGPGYQKNPDHRITLSHDGKRVRITVGGETIVDTGDAVTLHEGNYPAVYYVPRKDAKMDRLVKTEHSTYCPYKGDASYYSLSAGGDTVENAVWSYETPYDEVMEIKEHLAFYPKKVDKIEAV
jgi:uncharacterized protein (DUF427 family)